MIAQSNLSHYVHKQTSWIYSLWNEISLFWQIDKTQARRLAEKLAGSKKIQNRNTDENNNIVNIATYVIPISIIQHKHTLSVLMHEPSFILRQCMGKYKHTSFM